MTTRGAYNKLREKFKLILVNAIFCNFTLFLVNTLFLLQEYFYLNILPLSIIGVWPVFSKKMFI